MSSKLRIAIQSLRIVFFLQPYLKNGLGKQQEKVKKDYYMYLYIANQ